MFVSRVRIRRENSCFILDTTSQSSNAKDTIKEFHLDKAQLAFTIGQKILIDNNRTIGMIAYSSTTIFSDEIIEIVTRESHKKCIKKNYHPSNSSSCQVHTYAPRNGYTNGNDQVIIVFNNKLKPKKYGGKIIMLIFSILLLFVFFIVY